ncbi:hypothetical protein ACFL5L_02690 [candidate division KSB1 bacterium]
MRTCCAVGHDLRHKHNSLRFTLPIMIAVLISAIGGIQLQCGIPDEDRIIFASTRDGDSEIYMINHDGSGLSQLTFNSVEDSGPAGAPGGERFLYLSRLGEGETYEIMIGFYDSGRVHIQLTSDFYDEQNASWSPGGNKICFCRNVNGRSDIWVMDDRGENQEPITTNPGSDRQPEWSPGGDWIVYISDSPFDENGSPQICIIRSDGTEKTQLTSSATVKSDPSWSPDGSTIYYIEQLDEDQHFALKSVNRSAGEDAVITTFRERVVKPYMSRDNNVIVYSIAGKGTRSELYLYDLISGQEIRLTDNSYPDTSPRWTR